MNNQQTTSMILPYWDGCTVKTKEILDSNPIYFLPPSLLEVDELFLFTDVSLTLLDGYCSAEVPEYVSTSNEDDDLPVRWKAPECLKENRYSPTSDVWAFGVLMCEVLTYGCTPYRHVFRDDEVPPRVSNS